MPPIQDHPKRYSLANELHARPFPTLRAPCRAVFLAVKPSDDPALRPPGRDLEHLIALLDRYGAPHPQPGATHYSGQIGKHALKWEQHTEFVTYTVFLGGLGERAFDPADFDVFPSDWLDEDPGVRMTSALIRILPAASDEAVSAALEDWFVPESLAVSRVLDNDAVVAGDFRIDPGGHQRFAIFTADTVGERRVGRIAQRICEIETYKTMSMLGFSEVREIGGKMNEIDAELTRLMGIMTREGGEEEATLRALLRVSAEVESLSAQTSFRFGATGAYEAIVAQRVAVLRETRFLGRQTFSEFMMRRFDPAMRTVKSAEARLSSMAERASRAADLLRTRVEVGRAAQNQQLLESMDKRARLQLQLQETVEGLSVVAISYYAVSLGGYLLYPVAGWLGISKGLMTALLVVPVLALVWLGMRRVRHALEGQGPDM